MADRAHITSIEAIDEFRARLIVFLEKATQTIDEISEDVLRTRVWLESDQRLYWDREIRRRRQLLELAEGDLRGARISKLGESTALQEARVKTAKRSLREAEEKLVVVRKWKQQMGGVVDPLMKQLGKLENYLTGDMGEAVHWLTTAGKALAEYASLQAPSLNTGEKTRPVDEEESGGKTED